MAKKPAKRTVKAWAVLDDTGQVYEIGNTGKEARAWFCKRSRAIRSWSYWRQCGYRCVPVIISEVKR